MKLFSVISEEEKLRIQKRVAVMLNETEEKVAELFPVWEAIILGGLLKLVRNRIRFNALYNFILQKPIPVDSIEAYLGESKADFDLEAILRFGEGMMSILVPDKKSAIAMLLSRDLGCKSSSVLKGLTLFFGFYGYKLKQTDYPALKDWKAYSAFYLAMKSDFNALCSGKVQYTISDILLLSDILKVDPMVVLAYSEESELAADPAANFFQRLTLPMILSVVSVLILGGFLIWYTSFREVSDVDNLAETEEIIPLDSLSKLNDSLTQAVLDSNRLKSDSLTTLVWPDGKPFDVAKTSIVVPVFRYLMDSTQKESESFLATELQFDAKTDLLNGTNEQVFKSLAEGLYKFKEVQIKVVVNSDKDDRASLKRGFVLKNRLVGEGVTPARIEVKSSDPSVTFSSGESEVYLVLSKGRY
jgi:hypothetical protein